MDNTTFTPAPQRVHRKRKQLAAATPVGPLELVAVAYESGNGDITLTFNRAIDIAAMDVSAIVVNDGTVGLTYQGWGTPTLAGTDAVTVVLNGTEDFVGPDARLTVTPENGIVASGDGAAWMGVTGVVVPFG